MALVRSSKNVEGAILVDEHQAAEEQWKLIYEFKRKLFYLSGGSFITATASGITGFAICNYYRKRLKLEHYGHMSTFIPLIVLPIIFTTFTHKYYIADDIVLEKTKCSVCLETKATAYQIGFGVLYPLLLSPTVNYLMVNKYYTIRMPVLFLEPKKFWAFHMNISKNLYRKLYYPIIFNAVFAIFITNMELSNYYTFKRYIHNVEKRLISEGKIDN